MEKRIKARIRITAEKAVKIFYPVRCPICGQIPLGKDPHGLVCDVCAVRLIYTGENYCMKCGRPISSEQEEYCGHCLKHKHFFERCRAVFSYQGAVRTSIYQFKYANKREYALYYGQEMWHYLGSWIRELHPDFILPVPIHPRRRRQRGYNQAALLVKVLSMFSGLPADTKSLVRIRNTTAQKQLTASERSANMKDAFAVKGTKLRGKRILLVDDIYTTGATADAAAKALKAAGAKTVYVICVAVGG